MKHLLPAIIASALVLLGSWGLSYAATSVFAVFQGGTGQSSFTGGNLLEGNGTNPLQSVATSSVTNGTGISFGGTAGALVGGTSLTITNTGVTSNVAGTGISVSGATGAVTIGNTGVITLGNGTGTTCSGTNPGTCNVNTTQNITTLSNLTVAGLVQTTSGGALSSALLTSGQVTTALGFTPFGGTNPLPIANGGTNATSFTTSNNAVYFDGTRLVTAGTAQAVTTPYSSSTALSAASLYGTGLTSGNCVQASTNGLLTTTGSACGAGGGTNFWTSLGGNIYNNTGAQVQSPSFAATSTTATSTFKGDVVIGANTSVLPNPDLYIGTSTVAFYGRVPGDLIDAELDTNGTASINVANAMKGTCAAATYFADGNNPTLGGYYGTFSFLNDGWTNSGGAGCGLGVSNTDKPEAVAIASPTGEMDFDIASTTNLGYADFNWNVNNVTKLKLTNGGNLGLGTTTPYGEFAIASTSNAALQVADGFNTPVLTVQTASTTADILDVASTTGTVFLGVAQSGLTTLASTTISNNSNTSFTVGPNGSTNPVLQVDSSVASQGTGLDIQGVAAGTTGGTVLTTTSSGANEDLTVQSKGTGNLLLVAGSSGAGTIKLQASGLNRYVINTTTQTWTQGASNTATNVRYSFTDAADSALTAGTEAPEMYMNWGSATRNHATGAIALQRDTRITGDADSFTGASTITTKAVLSIDGVSAGTNATFSTSTALYIPGGAVTGTVTNAVGLDVQSTSGATNNYAAWFNGRILANGLNTSTAGNAVCQITGGELVNAGGVTCATSSKYTKYDIRTMDGAEAMKEVMALQPVLFNYIDGNRKDVTGVIAEQAAQVAPGIVTYATSVTTVDGHTFQIGDPYAVDPSAEAGLLFKASQYEEGQILAKTGGVAHDAEDNWQWGAIGLLVLWNIYLTFKKK